MREYIALKNKYGLLNFNRLLSHLCYGTRHIDCCHIYVMGLVISTAVTFMLWDSSYRLLSHLCHGTRQIYVQTFFYGIIEKNFYESVDDNNSLS